METNMVNGYNLAALPEAMARFFAVFGRDQVFAGEYLVQLEKLRMIACAEMGIPIQGISELQLREQRGFGNGTIFGSRTTTAYNHLKQWVADNLRFPPQQPEA
ncbi:hypothetical protein KW786_02385 [Candidatus Parcubacteria bacterium]|nr:hypothetical protein [Candidatus Parcubacteria bacterium]